MARSTGKAPRARTGGQYAPAGGRVVKVHGTKGKTATGRGGHQKVENSIKSRTVKSNSTASTATGKGGHQAIVSSIPARVVTVGGQK